MKKRKIHQESQNNRFDVNLADDDGGGDCDGAGGGNVHDVEHEARGGDAGDNHVAIFILYIITTTQRLTICVPRYRIIVVMRLPLLISPSLLFNFPLHSHPCVMTTLPHHPLTPCSSSWNCVSSPTSSTSAWYLLLRRTRRDWCGGGAAAERTRSRRRGRRTSKQAAARSKKWWLELLLVCGGGGWWWCLLVAGLVLLRRNARRTDS